MRISYSKWDKFRTCPYKYKLHYIDGWRLKRTKAIYAFGDCCHEAITGSLKFGLDPVSIFTNLWNEQQDCDLDYGNDDSFNKLTEIGKVLMARTVDKLKVIQNVSHVEEYFKMPFEGRHELEGYVDFIGDLKGVLTIFDIKSGKSFTDFEAKLSEQLTFYATALGIKNVALITLSKTKTNPAVKILTSMRPVTRIDDFRKTLLMDILRLENLKLPFTKANNKTICQMCDFKAICFGTKREIDARLQVKERSKTPTKQKTAFHRNLPQRNLVNVY